MPATIARRNRTSTVRVYLFPADQADLAHEAESLTDAAAFADEYNRLESERQSTGLIAVADLHGTIRKPAAV